MRIYIRNIKSRAASVSNHKDINKYDTARHTKTGQILGYFNPPQTLRLSGKIETENQSKNHDSNLPILIQSKLKLFWIILLFRPICHNVLIFFSMMTYIRVVPSSVHWIVKNFGEDNVAKLQQTVIFNVILHCVTVFT